MRVEDIKTTPVNVMIRALTDDGDIIVLMLDMDTVGSAVRRELSEKDARQIVERHSSAICEAILDKHIRGEAVTNLNIRGSFPEDGGFKQYSGGPYMEVQLSVEELRAALFTG